MDNVSLLFSFQVLAFALRVSREEFLVELLEHIYGTDALNNMLN